MRLCVYYCVQAVEDVVEVHNCHVTGLAIHQVGDCCLQTKRMFNRGW